MLWKRFVLAPHERGLVTKNGRFGGIFAPGEYAMFLPENASVEIERHDVRDVVFRSAWADYLLKRPKLSRRHFQCVRTNEVQVAMVYLDGRLFQVLTPAKGLLFWRGAAVVTAELVDVVGKASHPQETFVTRELAADEFAGKWKIDEKIQGRLFFLRSRLARSPSPGKYGCEIRQNARTCLLVSNVSVTPVQTLAPGRQGYQTTPER
jgi:hypothetical protein